MTPANNEYDSGSLKRRDPRKMFTDSSFYSAKHHPTVADQVEMAHKLSSAMFNEKNKSTKGQQMFLSRVQNAGEEEVLDHGDPNKVPNLKHVMNPEGRMTEWEDVTKEGKIRAENEQNLRRYLEVDIPKLYDSLRDEVGNREAMENRILKRANEEIGRLQDSIVAEKRAREETEEAMLRMMEDVVSKMQGEIAQERREREQTEETLLKLLEDTCNKLNQASQSL